LSSDVISGVKIVKKALAASVPPQISLEQLTTLPRSPLARLRGGYGKGGGKGKGG